MHHSQKLNYETKGIFNVSFNFSPCNRGELKMGQRKIKDAKKNKR
jgi:hypothetical protein